MERAPCRRGATLRRVYQQPIASGVLRESGELRRGPRGEHPAGPSALRVGSQKRGRLLLPRRPGENLVVEDGSRLVDPVLWIRGQTIESSTPPSHAVPG